MLFKTLLTLFVALVVAGAVLNNWYNRNCDSRRKDPPDWVICLARFFILTLVACIVNVLLIVWHMNTGTQL